jgi:hypothetical protein
MQKALDTHQEYTKGEFQGLRKDMKDWNQTIHDKLDKFIDKVDKNYATKQDHEENSKRITELESDKKAILKWIVISFIWILATLLWISKYFL